MFSLLGKDAIHEFALLIEQFIVDSSWCLGWHLYVIVVLAGVALLLEEEVEILDQ